MPWDQDLSWPIQSTSWQHLHLLSTSYCHWWHIHFLSSQLLFGVLPHLILHLILWLHTPSNNKLNLCSYFYLHTISQTASKRRMCDTLVIYRPQRSCGQGYVFTRVCDSVHGGGVSPGRENSRQTRQTPPDQANPPGPGRPPWQGEPPPGPGRPPRDQADPPLGSRLQNMVYEQPVHILLECILVIYCDINYRP